LSCLSGSDLVLHRFTVELLSPAQLSPPLLENYISV